MWNPLKDIEKANLKLDGFYRGIVVDNQSPKKDGRVRVRIFGVYDDLTKDEIPWSEPALPLNTGGKLDQGSIFVPELNSYLFCFFDSGDVNHPVYFASCPSIQDDEPDIPREARREKLDETYLTKRREERIENIESSDQIKWSEPEPWFDGEYPYNHVIKLSNGIIIELDNSPTRERIHFYHPSNSLIEIDKNGNMHIRNSNNKYALTLQNKKEYIGGDNILDIDKSRFMRITGDERKRIFEEKILWISDKEHITIDVDRRESIGGDKDLTVTGNQNENIGGNKNINVTGNLVENIDGNHELNIGGNLVENVDGNYELNINGNLLIKVTGNCIIDAAAVGMKGSGVVVLEGSACLVKASGVALISGSSAGIKASGSAVIESSGSFGINSSGAISFDAPAIKFQEGGAGSAPSEPTGPTGSPSSPSSPEAPKIPTLPHEETQES